MMNGRTSAFVLSALALLLVADLGFAQSTSPFSHANDIFRTIPSWWGLVAVGLGLSVVIISLAYMIGEAGNLPNVKAFAKQEVYELASTVIVLVMILASLFAYGVFASDIAHSSLVDSSAGMGEQIHGTCADKEKVYILNDASRPEARLFAEVDWFLGCIPSTKDSTLFVGKLAEMEVDSQGETSYETLWKAQKEYYGESDTFGNRHSEGVMLGHMMNIYASIFSLEFLLGPISTFGLSAYAPEPIISSISLDMAPTSGLTPLSEALIMLTDMIGIGLVVVMIQKILLQYVYHNALAVFLPVGIGFKAIPFLRKTGATIIAATLVMYFIFPMSLWINEQIYFNSLFSYNDDTGEYMPDMIDWTNYESIMQVTAPESSEENYNELYGRIRTENVEPFYEQTNTVNDAIIEDVYGEEVTSRLPRAVHRAVLNSFKDNGAIVGGYFFHYASILGPMLPIEYFFGAITDMFTTSMQWFALNLLFLANTIILCVTFFKDLSIAIGGEPRIFGMSRLL